MRRGASLLELLVATAIGMVILTAVFYAFFSSLQLMRWVSVRSDVGQSALLGLDRLSRELRSSTFNAITVEPGPVAGAGGITAGPIIAFQVECSDSEASIGMGFQADQEEVVYYQDQTHQTLVRKVWRVADPVPTPPPSGVRMQPADIATVVATPNGTEKIMASNLNVTASTPGMVVNPSSVPVSTTGPTTVTEGLTITLDIKETPAHGSPEEQSVVTTVHPRNPP